MIYRKYVFLFAFISFSCKEIGMIKPENSIKEFNQLLKKSKISYNEISVENLIQQQIMFYKEKRVKKVSYENDGDMILVQWGIYDWGAGKYFEFDIARQYIEIDKDGDDAISQFHTTLYFDNEAFNEIKPGNKWFNSIENVGEIENYILQQDFYKILITKTPLKREINWEYQ